jgi:hypothetical protein
MKSIDTHWLGNFYQNWGVLSLDQHQKGSAAFRKGRSGFVLQDMEDISCSGA